jgi:hypothetical protein
VASGTVAVDPNSSGGGLSANVPAEAVEVVEEAKADDFAILPAVPVIYLQSNQPYPSARMAMTDNGEAPKLYWPDATVQWHEAKL